MCVWGGERERVCVGQAVLLKSGRVAAARGVSVWRLGFGVWGFGVSGFGFRVSGLGFRVRV